jgi:hypothetical protein
MFRFFGAEVFRPPVDQELRMRSPHSQLLSLRSLQEVCFAAHAIAQHSIDQRSIAAFGELHGFVDGGVLRGLKKKQLIEAKPQQVARAVIEMAGPKPADPKIEQCQVAKDAVKKLGTKGAIRRREFAGSQTLGQDGIGKFPSTAPLFQSGEGDTA